MRHWYGLVNHNRADEVRDDGVFIQQAIGSGKAFRTDLRSPIRGLSLIILHRSQNKARKSAENGRLLTKVPVCGSFPYLGIKTTYGVI